MLLALTPESGTAAHASVPNAAERSLLDAIRRGDERQASQVYASLLPAVQATLLRVLGGPYPNHRELARRSIEAVIVELARHRSPWTCRLEVWAMTSAARVALDVLCARVERQDGEVFWNDAPTPSSPHPTSAGSAIARLRVSIAELPRREAEAVMLCDVMGLDARDIAVTFSVAVEHVRGLLSAGHERLARQTSVSAGD